jgi:hypothetical protein
MLRSLTSNTSIEAKRVKTYKKQCSEKLNFYPSSELMFINREKNGQGRTQVIINKHTKFKLENLLEKIQLGDQSVSVIILNISQILYEGINGIAAYIAYRLNLLRTKYNGET